ncbi:LOW QUALITY PROTEIN: hypothetical protein V1478_004643 [Vespula squamosa]|uniref:Uncharacterized protein n=1 Tax=Vespula squamosa TaxID=30214 RepID=A0ABD2BH32_VESSQ
MQPPTNHPPTISTYLIFNQLRIIHPQFRPKSRSSVLEPSQNFLSNAFSYLELTIVIEYSIVVVRARSKEEAICRRGPHKLWLKRATIRLLRKTLTRVTAGTRVGVSGASLSPTEDCVLIFEISKDRHDRSCLEMSEADGVDGGAFRKRGLTHLQWAEKPEAPEAERHLGTRISRVSVSPWVPECSNLLAVGPGSEILALYDNLMGSKYFRANSCILQNFSKFFPINSKLKMEVRQMTKGPILEGPMLEGPIFEGPIFEGPIFEGPIIERSIIAGFLYGC